jgi:hypothetical protein
MSELPFSDLPERSQVYDLDIVQGETLERTFTWKIDDVKQDLDPYTLRSQIRKKEDPNSDMLVDLAQYMTKVDDTIVLKVPRDTFLAVPVNLFRTAAWDLFLDEDADPTRGIRLLQGAVALDPAASNVL